MEDNRRVFLFDEFRNGVDIVYRARFVVYVNDGHKSRFLVYTAQKIVNVNASVVVKICKPRLNASFFQFAETFVNGGMFSARRNGVSSFSKRENRGVIRFASARNENRFKGRGKTFQNFLSDFVYPFFNGKTAGIKSRRIPEIFFVIFYGFGENFLVGFRRCRVIEINHYL